MALSESDKARRHAQIGRVCILCSRSDSQITWSNRPDMCCSCERTRPRGASFGPAKDKPPVETLEKLYEQNGKLARFHSKEADLDESELAARLANTSGPDDSLPN